jgi:hypothetical protein
VLVREQYADLVDVVEVVGGGVVPEVFQADGELPDVE